MTYKMTLRRKLALSAWAAPREGNIYGKITVDPTKAQQYLDELNRNLKSKITITHFVGKLAGLVLAEMPDLNGRILFGRYKPHKTMALSFLVQIGEGENLGKVKVENINTKTLAQVAQELRESALKLRKGKDENFKKNNLAIKLLPGIILKPFLLFVGYLCSAIGVNAKFLGLEAFPFGSCIVTSVGMFGLEEAYVPPTPFARVPIYVSIFNIRDMPVVEDHTVVIRPQLTLTATIDHRFVDGFQGGILSKKLKYYFEHPEKVNQSVLVAQ